MNSLAQQVLGSIARHGILRAGDRVGVAVSGGIDSVALLRLLLELRSELGVVLSVVHFNHKLRGAESDADEQFVADLAREYDLEFYCDSDDVAGHAREEGVSLETAARELRYGFFRHLIREEPQGLKPSSEAGLDGTPEAVPFHKLSSLRSAGTELEPSSLRSATDETRPDKGATGHKISEVKTSTLSQNARQGWGTPASSLVSLDKILTGHTLDDQAETVLMRIIRGAGLKGIGGIYPRIAVENEDGEFLGEIVRPLLDFRRRELQVYLEEIGQSWREDATNDEEKFTRNRVRKLVLPLLEKEFNPVVAENLAELAEIARGEEDYWENEIAGWMGTGVHWSEPEWARRESSTGLVQIMTSGIPADNSADSRLRAKIESATWLVMNASVDRVWILGEPVAVQRRVIKAIGEHAGISLEFKHVEEVLRFAAEEAGSGKELALPLGWKVERHPDELVFVTPDLRDAPPPGDYEFVVTVPGEVRVGEAGSIIEIRRVPSGMEAGYNPDHLFDVESLPGPLTVRNWRAGDRFWPRHTKAPKKVKELLQERHVEPAQRKLWPVIVSGNEIVWMRGFPPPARFAARPGREAMVIVESLLAAAPNARGSSAGTRGGHEKE
ncbi:MAG TPA: tRNA lysidine(34) synthetase TilS [Candidatus Binatia bacterium]|nr:tRNA lysidine(34) synthetase TilS [Candidatus Binatia bacterium]